MSYRVMDLVWASVLLNPDKTVLAGLANRGDDNGEKIYPSIRKLAMWCGLSERTVQRSIRKLQKMKIVEQTRKPDFKRQFPAHYKIDVDYIRSLSMDGDTQSPPTDSHRLNRGCHTVTGVTQSPVTDSHQPGVTQSPKLSLELYQEDLGEEGVFLTPRIQSNGHGQPSQAGQEILQGKSL